MARQSLVDVATLLEKKKKPTSPPLLSVVGSCSSEGLASIPLTDATRVGHDLVSLYHARRTSRLRSDRKMAIRAARILQYLPLVQRSAGGEIEACVPADLAATKPRAPTDETDTAALIVRRATASARVGKALSQQRLWTQRASCDDVRHEEDLCNQLWDPSTGEARCAFVGRTGEPMEVDEEGWASVTVAKPGDTVTVYTNEEPTKRVTKVVGSDGRIRVDPIQTKVKAEGKAEGEAEGEAESKAEGKAEAEGEAEYPKKVIVDVAPVCQPTFSRALADFEQLHDDFQEAEAKRAKTAAAFESSPLKPSAYRKLLEGGIKRLPKSLQAVLRPAQQVTAYERLREEKAAAAREYDDTAARITRDWHTMMHRFIQHRAAQLLDEHCQTNCGDPACVKFDEHRCMSKFGKKKTYDIRNKRLLLADPLGSVDKLLTFEGGDHVSGETVEKRRRLAELHALKLKYQQLAASMPKKKLSGGGGERTAAQTCLRIAQDVGRALAVGVVRKISTNADGESVWHVEYIDNGYIQKIIGLTNPKFVFPSASSWFVSNQKGELRLAKVREWKETKDGARRYTVVFQDGSEQEVGQESFSLGPTKDGEDRFIVTRQNNRWVIRTFRKVAQQNVEMHPAYIIFKPERGLVTSVFEQEGCHRLSFQNDDDRHRIDEAWRKIQLQKIDEEIKNTEMDLSSSAAAVGYSGIGVCYQLAPGNLNTTEGAPLAISSESIAVVVDRDDTGAVTLAVPGDIYKHVNVRETQDVAVRLRFQGGRRTAYAMKVTEEGTFRPVGKPDTDKKGRVILPPYGTATKFITSTFQTILKVNDLERHWLLFGNGFTLLRDYVSLTYGVDIRGDAVAKIVDAILPINTLDNSADEGHRRKVLHFAVKDRLDRYKRQVKETMPQIFASVWDPEKAYPEQTAEALDAVMNGSELKADTDESRTEPMTESKGDEPDKADSTTESKAAEVISADTKFKKLLDIYISRLLCFNLGLYGLPKASMESPAESPAPAADDITELTKAMKLRSPTPPQGLTTSARAVLGVPDQYFREAAASEVEHMRRVLEAEEKAKIDARAVRAFESLTRLVVGDDPSEKIARLKRITDAAEIKAPADLEKKMKAADLWIKDHVWLNDTLWLPYDTFRKLYNEDFKGPTRILLQQTTPERADQINEAHAAAIKNLREDLYNVLKDKDEHYNTLLFAPTIDKSALAVFQKRQIQMRAEVKEDESEAKAVNAIEDATERRNALFDGKIVTYERREYVIVDGQLFELQGRRNDDVVIRDAIASLGVDRRLPYITKSKDVEDPIVLPSRAVTGVHKNSPFRYRATSYGRSKQPLAVRALREKVVAMRLSGIVVEHTDKTQTLEKLKDAFDDDWASQEPLLDRVQYIDCSKGGGPYCERQFFRYNFVPPESDATTTDVSCVELFKDGCFVYFWTNDNVVLDYFYPHHSDKWPFERRDGVIRAIVNTLEAGSDPSSLPTFSNYTVSSTFKAQVVAEEKRLAALLGFSPYRVSVKNGLEQDDGRVIYVATSEQETKQETLYLSEILPDESTWVIVCDDSNKTYEETLRQLLFSKVNERAVLVTKGEEESQTLVLEPL